MKQIARDLLSTSLTQLVAQGIIAQIDVPITILDNKSKEHGICASNIALVLAKKNQLKPRDLAHLICANLPKHNAVSKVEIAGAGFINFHQNNNYLANKLEQILADGNCGIVASKQAQTVVIDLSGPNLAKEMHVGHLRSTIIGDCVANVLTILGNNVIRQNHVGDWGTQFGMLLAYLAQHENNLERELSDLEQFYRAAKLQFDQSAEFAHLAREMVVKLQSGDQKCRKLWTKFNQISLNHCQKVYNELGVNLTSKDVKGESSYNADLPNVINDLKSKNLLKVSDGANCVFMEQFTNSEGQIIPLIVQKADGGYLYATTDLAALRYRANVLQATRIIYFVDMRQALHFQMVFAVAVKAEFVPNNIVLEFMGFGTLNDANGRPFKTRDGGTVRLLDLLQEANLRAKQLIVNKNPNLDEIELNKIASAVAIGAVKYADLSKNRTSDYNFSFDQMLKFDGNTAPYLMYAYTRVVSLLNKAELSLNAPIIGNISLNDEYEIDLANKLVQFNEVLHKVAEFGSPHLLCTYLYELAGNFSSFYENCPVLTAADEASKNSRLKLSKLCGQIMRCGLELLGIKVLERM